MTDLHIRKLCNALIPDATTSELVPSVASGAAERLGRKMGGLWVGGRVEITEEGLTFAANGLNRAFHANLSPVHIPMSVMHKARPEFGWFTGIVAVEHDGGTFRFRCYGSKKVAAVLAAHLAQR
ncbi:hypothetical protein [Labrys neptuniae]